MSNIKISTKNLDLYYGENHALKNINMNIKAGAITAFIGPSGCGKSTFLKTLNRMNDLVDNVKITGEVKIDGEDIYDPHVDLPSVFPAVSSSVSALPVPLLFHRKSC